MPDSPANTSTKPPHPDDLERVEALLEHFEQLEQQFQHVREGLTRSHRLATLGTIASIIAHEYNNILTPLISYSEFALANPDDADLMKKAVERTLTGAERASKISSSLLGFAREADEQHAAPLRRTIDEAITCMGRPPEKDGIKLTIDVPDVRVAISPMNLQQVLLNLALNARTAMQGRSGSLSITGTEEGGLLRLAVADSGPGIPAEVADRLFEPFVTHRPTPADHVPAEHGDPKGTGLGLCICRDLIRSAGGSVTVDSTPGEGATFNIVLPIADDLFAAA